MITFRRPLHDPDAYLVYYEATGGRRGVGRVRKYRKHANVRPRPLRWVEWRAWDPDGNEVARGCRTRADAARRLVELSWSRE